MALVTYNVLQRARDSGRCPPSLLTEDRILNDDGFEAAVAMVLDASGLSLASDPSVADNFSSLLQFVTGIEKIPGDADLVKKKAILEYRRCLILAIVGGTSATNPSLPRILSDGYLTVVKSWLDDILRGSVGKNRPISPVDECRISFVAKTQGDSPSFSYGTEGGIDLLLHMLTNLAHLPVTKAVVMASGMGKAVGSIEKHKIGEGTPNEVEIKDRVQQVKDAWNASVKQRKEKVESETIKRKELERPLDASPPAKKVKAEETKKPSSFSNLLKKVSVPSSDALKGKVARATPNGMFATSGRTVSPSAAVPNLGLSDKLAAADMASNTLPKKPAKRVKWADHFGGSLTASQVLTPEGVDDTTQTKDANVSWSDRKKRDRLREKELLAKAKRAKLTDDDEDDIDAPKLMVITSAWRQPSLLPDRPEVVKPQLESREIAVQFDRMTKVPPARYVAEYDVPNSPAPLSDVEQALDMTSQASAVVSTIPFFAPQPSAPTTTQAPDTTSAYSHSLPATPGLNIPVQPQSGSVGATAETLQALGLPMFLIGQNVQALQTLASTPSLLSTFVDANGLYDQPRLMNLVQTLSQNITPAPTPAVGLGGQPFQPPAFSAPAPTPSYGTPSAPPAYQSPSGIYGPASNSYGQTSAPYNYDTGAPGAYGATPKNGYRGSQNDDGNLHLSGYGPTTTQADIITLFSPYVKVDEVVMKGTFTFVNTSDAIGAQRAREALSGALLGGMPIRIKQAQRKARDLTLSGSAPASIYGPASSTADSRPPVAPRPPVIPPYAIVNEPVPVPLEANNGYIDVDAVRDDRGNPATKNLFVAGYGPGTTELQLREIFSSHGQVVGVVLKGSFSFVNTYDRLAAIRAREALSGKILNGGVLRINFAKETGRLGTSFDLTYGPNTAKPHYGRNFI